MEDHLCEDCGLPLVRKNGKGPWPKRCGECKRKRHVASRQAHAEGRQPADPPTALPPVGGEPEPPKSQGYLEVSLRPDGASVFGPCDAQHDACRKEAWDLAIAQGFNARGGWTNVRLNRVIPGEDVTYVYRVEVRP